jgi:hypothetical protein
MKVGTKFVMLGHVDTEILLESNERYFGFSWEHHDRMDLALDGDIHEL